MPDEIGPPPEGGGGWPATTKVNLTNSGPLGYDKPTDTVYTGVLAANVSPQVGDRLRYFDGTNTVAAVIHRIDPDLGPAILYFDEALGTTGRNAVVWGVPVVGATDPIPEGPHARAI